MNRGLRPSVLSMEYLMGIRMTALRRCYVPSLQGEFESGQSFEADNEREAVRLERKRTARRGEPTVKAKVADEPPAPHVDPLEEARSKYRTATGRDPDMRWGLARLQNEVSVAPTYSRRDMRAEDE